jgi:hypothetical protein
MPEELKKRIKSFLWRAGALVALSGFSYLANVQDVQSIEWNKLMTLLLTGFSALVVSEITKTLNK